ncbi:hypothetical protein [Sulfurimonas sp.]|uniref:hypothetical protein n=1 Tax=Sulfurimonas sp. TaxID=2022749 RepID=UPI0025D09EFE|nr:hypothetical protein [Sulfurimonas sp.]
MQIKLFFVVIALIICLSAQSDECKVDDNIMYGIATIEKNKHTPVGYPFLISLNSAKDQKSIRANDELSYLFLDVRTIDCVNQKNCVSVLKSLKAKGIKNLDLGAFQICQLFWEMPEADYFDIKKSYLKACSIVMSHNKKKWSWKNIAKYHSKTKKHNNRYKKELLAAVKKNLM